MKGLVPFFFCLALLPMRSQELEKAIPADSLYLEDQFYFGITYDFLLERPGGITQSNLSYGLQFGFIKDIPLNGPRNVSFGIGIGYAANSYYSNLLASKTGNDVVYSILGPDADFKRNKIENHLVELPLEFRWRNSTPSEYKFWRIYTGLKLGYVLGSRSKFVSAMEKISFTNKDIRDFQYGITLSVGYNTFNIHAYYSLVNLFNDGASIDNGETLTLKPLRIGIIFYIL